MTYGFSPRQAYSLYRSIRKTVFPEWGIPPMRIQFSALPYTAHGWPAGFGGMGTTLFELSKPLKPAYALMVDGAFLPYMHEDELEGIIRHEIAHIIAGYDADHKKPWKEVATYLGTIPLPYVLLREWESIPESVYDPDPRFLKRLDFTPTFG